MKNSYFVPNDRRWLKFYPQGMPKHLDYPEVPLYQFLDDSAKKFPDRTALVFYGKKISYQSLKDLSDRFAHALQDLGIKQGDRVAFLLPNSPEFVIAYFGTLKAGGVVVPLNPLYLSKELNHLLADAKPKILVSLKMFAPKLKTVKKEIVPILIFSDLAAYLPLPLKSLLKIKNWSRSSLKLDFNGQLFNFEKLLEKYSKKYQKVNLQPKDLALLVYTSGTTGNPKGVRLTYENVVANLIQMKTWLRDAIKVGQDIELGVLPFFHIYGITVVLNLAMNSALTLILFPEFHSKEVAKAIGKYKITLAPVVPVMLQVIFRRYREAPKKYDFSSVHFWGTGAGACDPDLIKKINRLKGKVIEGYGLTETSPILIMNPYNGQQKIGSIGLPLPDTDCRVVDLETGEEVPPGKEGELLVKGPQVFSGYWHNQEATEKIFSSDGWFHTHDVALIDAEGYVFLKGRVDDMINIGGEKLWPQEVERVLKQHPGVEDAAVVGYPDMYFGEIPAAYVVPTKENKEPTALQWELPDFCKKFLTPYKIPNKILLVSKIPKSHIGKTLYYQLRENSKKS